MGDVKIPYYVVPRGKRCGYWRPTARMKALGFQDVRCGPDGPAAWAIAETWNRRWQAVRCGQSAPPNAQDGQGGRKGPEQSEAARIYPPGSVGAAFAAYRLTEEWTKKAQSTRQCIWWPAWSYIRPVWGDCDPDTISFEMMSVWRSDLEREHSLNIAHKTLKIWRALWRIMVAMKIAHGEDPSKAVRNRAPLPRHQKWSEREAVHLAKRAWREGYTGLACIIAVSWDALFSPGDVRTLKAGHRRARSVAVAREGKVVKLRQRYFDKSEEGRAKTGRPAIGTVSRRTARLVDAYLAALGIELLPESILFRTRTGKPYQAHRLQRDFNIVRDLVFPGDLRQLRDMRRAGTIEAVAGGADGGELSSKLANSIDRSNTLRKTYAPIDVAAVINADEARRRGRKKLIGENEPW